MDDDHNISRRPGFSPARRRVGMPVYALAGLALLILLGCDLSLLGGPPGTPSVDAPQTGGQPAAQTTVVTVTTNDLSIRSGPDPNCALLGTYDNGQVVQVVAQSPDSNWWQVTYNQQMGWISKDFTSPARGPDVPTQSGPACQPGGSQPAATCGDGTCTPPENNDTCPADCPAAAVCGDGVCAAGIEDLASCPDDCALPAAVCGDGVCAAGIEDLASCPDDCN